MNKFFTSISCLALVLVLLLAGCGGGSGTQAQDTDPINTAGASESDSLSGQENDNSQSGAVPDSTVMITDQAGRQFVIEGTVERIVSGYYISSSACIALGLESKLVGIEAKADSRPIYSLAAPELIELPNVGTAKEFNLEGCIALDPDLVILPIRLRDSADTMAEMGIPVILVSPENHDDLVEMLELIGTAAGVKDSADKLTQYYNDEVLAIAELTKALSDKPIVYISSNSSYLTTAPKDMYQAELIKSAGGTNAGNTLDGDNWVEISYEQLLSMNPDVIVVPAEASYTVDDILSDPQLKELTAIKEQRVYQMPRDFEAWDSPVPSCTLGIRWMLYALHEDIYPLDLLQNEASTFYREFYKAEINTGLIGK